METNPFDVIAPRIREIPGISIVIDVRPGVGRSELLWQHLKNTVASQVAIVEGPALRDIEREFDQFRRIELPKLHPCMREKTKPDNHVFDDFRVRDAKKRYLFKKAGA